MQKKLATIISLVIIGIAAGLYFSSGGSKTQAREPFHEYVNPAELQRITIAQGGRVLELVPRGGSWFVQDDDLLIAVDASRLRSLLEFINEGTVLQRVTRKESNYPRFDLGPDTAVAVTLSGRQGAETLHIGKQKDQAFQFALRQNDPYVYLVSKSVTLSTDPATWYYQKVLDYNPDGLDFIRYGCPDRPVTLHRDALQKQLVIHDPPPGKQSAVPDKLQEYFINLSIAEYVPRSTAFDAAPVVTHELHFKDGSVVTLRFLETAAEENKRRYLDMTFSDGTPADEKLQYARDLSERFVFRISWIDKNKFLKAYDDFFTDAPPDNESASVAAQKK